MTRLGEWLQPNSKFTAKRRLRRPGILALILTVSSSALAVDTLSIISPHRKSIQREFIPEFEKYYERAYGKPVKVEWIDQGGTENDLRFVDAKFKRNPKSAGIDVFWGGGDLTFLDLERRGYLQKLPKEIVKTLPDTAAGIPLKSADARWIATAISSFGVFFNRRMIKFQDLAAPQTWEDLGNPSYLDMVSMADPRRSSSSLVMNMIVLYSLGWEKGWKTLTSMAGNTRSFTHSSSDPIKAVVSGDVAAATAIDFYAAAKIARLGSQNLGFVLPPGKTIFNSDPIAVLKGAPNTQAAQRFVKFVVSPRAQKLLVLKKGVKHGPKHGLLGRMAVHPLAYEASPSLIISPSPFSTAASSFTFDMAKLTAQKAIISDLVGAFHCDTHHLLQKAWKVAVRSGSQSKVYSELLAPPISEAQLEKLRLQWADQILRNRTINVWVQQAKARYSKLAGLGNG